VIGAVNVETTRGLLVGFSGTMKSSSHKVVAGALTTGQTPIAWSQRVEANVHCLQRLLEGGIQMRLESIDADSLPEWDRQVLISADSDAKEDKSARWMLWGSIGTVLAWFVTEFVLTLELRMTPFFLVSAIAGFGARAFMRERAAWIRIARRLDAAKSVGAASH